MKNDESAPAVVLTDASIMEELRELQSFVLVETGHMPTVEAVSLVRTAIKSRLARTADAAARLAAVEALAAKWDGHGHPADLLDALRAALSATAPAAGQREAQERAQVLRELAEQIDNGDVTHEDLRRCGVSNVAPLGWSDKSVIDAYNSGSVWSDFLRSRAAEYARADRSPEQP